jgi:chromosomal replication initiator protein
LPDLETRTAILKTKQAQANIELPSEIVDFIATNVKSNIRRLEGAMIRTMSYASLTGRELTVSAVENLLKDTLDKEQTQQVSVDLIQRTVAEHYDVRLSDMSSKRRQRSVALPRQVAMFLCRKMTPHSLPDIANSFGKTHATILHAYRSIDKKMGADDSFRREVTGIADTMGHSLS